MLLIQREIYEKVYQGNIILKTRLGVENMPRHGFLLTIIFAVMFLTPSIAATGGTPINQDFVTSSWSGGLVIDHTTMDLNLIPSEYIEDAQDNVKIHYAHTSHGGQITEGLSRIEAANSSHAESCQTHSGTLAV